MQVTELQVALNALGWMPALTIDGDYGPATKAAVEAFQQANKITPVDGIAGPVTGSAIAAKLRAAGKTSRGIPVAMAAVLDCTDWDTPSGGWVMPDTVGTYRFFYQPAFPGGGYGSNPLDNQELSCGHVQVPADPAVVDWVKTTATAFVRAAPAGTKFFCLLIRGLTLGDDALSRVEYEQAVLTPLGVECEIVSEGLFAHDNQAANQQKLVDKYGAGYQLMVVGHSMGGDEVCAICQALATLPATA